MPNLVDISPIHDQIEFVVDDKHIPAGYSNDFWGGVMYVTSLLNSAPNRVIDTDTYTVLLTDIDTLLNTHYINQMDARNILEYIYGILYHLHPISNPNNNLQT